MGTFDSRTSCGRFFIAAVAFIVIWKKIAKCKKSKDHCEMATDCSFAKNAIVFLRLLSCQTIVFFEFLSPKFISNYYYGRENQNNSACQSNQAVIENCAEDMNFMSSVQF